MDKHIQDDLRKLAAALVAAAEQLQALVEVEEQEQSRAEAKKQDRPE